MEGSLIFILHSDLNLCNTAKTAIKVWSHYNVCQFWARVDFDGKDALHTTRSEATLENLQEVCVVAYV